MTAALVLSEAVFIPLMLVSLWGLAVIWPAGGGGCRTGRGGGWLWALGTGGGGGAAVLVRPSWLLFVPAMLLVWLVASGRGRRAEAVRGAVLVAVGFVAVMAPWWVRNARVYGRFVPTALWTGASLYDGLNPRATGASDMDAFLAEPDIWPLGEEAQDAELFRRAVAFARAHPRRVLELAAIKAARYWSPWPNAEGWKHAGGRAGQCRLERAAPGRDGGGGLGPAPRRPRPGRAGRAARLLRRAAHGLRQLDALPHPRRRAGHGAGGDRAWPVAASVRGERLAGDVSAGCLKGTRRRRG